MGFQTISPKPVLQIHNSRGIILATRALFDGFLHIKNNLSPITKEYTPQIVGKHVPLQT